MPKPSPPETWPTVLDLPPLVPLESPLRRVPENLNGNQRTVLDALRYSIEIVELTYKRLIVVMTNGVQKESGGIKEGVLAALLADAWAMVDSVNRMRVLVPLFDKKTPMPHFATRFVAETHGVNKLRNAFHHVPGRIEKLVSDNEPPLGILRWTVTTCIDPAKSTTYTAHPGSIKFQLKVYPTAGLAVWNQIDLVTLTAGKEDLCLSNLFRSVQAFTHEFQVMLKPAIAKYSTRAGDWLQTQHAVAKGPMTTGSL